MNFQVVLQRLARQDLREAYQWAARHAPETAKRWLDRFQDALRTLESQPERCPFARENLRVDVEIREFHFGKRPYRFRAIYTIEPPVVRILRIRRAQRRPLTRRQIDEALRLDE